MGSLVFLFSFFPPLNFIKKNALLQNIFKRRKSDQLMQFTNIAMAIDIDRTSIGLTKKTIQNNLILFVIIHRTLEK